MLDPWACCARESLLYEGANAKPRNPSSLARARLTRARAWRYAGVQAPTPGGSSRMRQAYDQDNHVWDWHRIGLRARSRPRSGTADVLRTLLAHFSGRCAVIRGAFLFLVAALAHSLSAQSRTPDTSAVLNLPWNVDLETLRRALSIRGWEIDSVTYTSRGAMSVRFRSHYSKPGDPLKDWDMGFVLLPPDTQSVASAHLMTTFVSTKQAFVHFTSLVERAQAQWPSGGESGCHVYDPHPSPGLPLSCSRLFWRNDHSCLYSISLIVAAGGGPDAATVNESEGWCPPYILSTSR